MISKKFFFSFGFVSVCLAGCVGDSVGRVSDGNNVRRVGHVRWVKEKAIDASVLAEKDIPTAGVSVFFLRAADQDKLETSANLSVNGRFQASLQPRNYTQVYSCSGLNDLSAEITGHKNNNLLKAVLKHEMKSGETYYFDVDVSNAGNSRIINLTAEDALARMKGMNHQNHQISRVVNNCPPQSSRIELKILFDTDKYQVKSKYYSEIERVARYMRKYPNTSVILEGHTDSQANEQYNEKLSKNRVDEVRNVIIQDYGILPSRVKARGYGESRPVASNNSKSGRQENRRVLAVFSVSAQ